MRERSLIFDTVTLSEGFFSGPNKVNCAAPYSKSEATIPVLNDADSHLQQVVVEGSYMGQMMECTFLIFGNQGKNLSKFLHF